VCHGQPTNFGWKCLSKKPRSRAAARSRASAGISSLLDDNRIVPKIGVGISRNPSSIEVLLAEVDQATTAVTINGSIMGVGPIQKNHLKSEVNRLRNAIEVAASQARRSQSSADKQAPAPSDPVEQIRRLGELRDAGVLSDAEFEAKKAELLGRL
jgi:Short C-terminal domain